MTARFTAIFALLAGWAALALGTSPLQAATPTAEQALALTPVQSDVDFDRPEAADTANCRLTPEKINGNVGWVVVDPQGLRLRVFLDTNGDNLVDQWCYYKDGIEVYRDIDANFNGKADQYRWFNTGGTRWALDKNEDGKIDAWKAISPEEVTAEVVAALAGRDAARFALVMLTPDELRNLGLGKEKAEQISARLAGLTDKFQKLANSQDVVGAKSSWSHFNGLRPGVVPAGADGSTKDVRVYENVSAFVENANGGNQVQVGTLIQSGDCWKLIDLPTLGNSEVAAGGLFFQPPMPNRTEGGSSMSSDALQKILNDLEALDRTAAAATTPQQQADYTSRRADLLEQAATLTTGSDHDGWVRQLADMIMSAVQNGYYADGPARLQALQEKLAKNEADHDLAAYVKFRQISAEYGLAMTTSRDFAKLQTEWLKKLEQYVADYPDSPDAGEAMLQLGTSQEFNGEEAKAKEWYTRIVKQFPNSAAAAKAAGAQTRLDSVGQVIRLSGSGANGKTIDLGAMRGKPVVIQYWATWSQVARSDMATLKDLLQKYGNSFVVLGVNLDTDQQQMQRAVADARISWPQIFEEGGLDSRPANQLGIITVPTMILVDQQGRVVNRNVQITELEDELKKLVR